MIIGSWVSIWVEKKVILMKNRNSVYATAYARKILGLTQKDVSHLKRIKKSNAQAKPINKHGNYDGTDVGFTSKSIGNPVKPNKTPKNKKKPIDRHGNYGGTDTGFTANFEN